MITKFHDSRSNAASPDGDQLNASAAKTRIQGLESLVAAARADRLPPVEAWDPPYCGDIGMAIRADGTWTYQGSPIGRQAMVKLFARILRKDADGRTWLVTPVEKVDVAVADAPFLAVEMEIEGAGAAQTVVLRTNVDDIVRVGPDHPLRFEREAATDGVKPYVLVRGRLEALVTRAVMFDLVALAEPAMIGGRAVLAVRSGGTLFAIG
ncbi:MAG: DUF1285 domain-containing protein [Hyphomicrobiaceae bacterium]